MDNEKKTNIAIIVAIIGALALVAVPIVTRLIDFYLPTPIPVSSQVAGESLPEGTANKQVVALSEKFDGSSGSYDTNLWDCGHECNIENIFLRDGVSTLHRNNEGYSYIISRSKWNYSDLVSLSGKFQVDKNSISGTVGWISLADSVTGCGFHVAETPYVQCDFGPNVDGKPEYITNELPINFDTWYSIKFEFDHSTNAVRYYLGSTLLGEYIPTKHSDTVQISSGIFSPSSGQIYIDDILLLLNK